MNLKKVISIFFVIVVIVNMILLGMGRIPVLLFWGVLIIAAIYVYFVMPKIKD